MNKKLAEIACITEKVETLMCMRETIDGIERSVQRMSNKYDEVLGKMKEQSNETSSLKKKMEQVEKRIDNQEGKH